MTLYLASLAPYFDLIYSHLPGGSFFGFLGTLPGSSSVTSTVFTLPDAGTVINTLAKLGVLG